MRKTFKMAAADFNNWYSERDMGYKTKCWICKNPDESRGGYGRIWFSGRGVSSHRFSWMVHRGKIPNNLEVCHHCDVAACCNVEHLFLGTHLENIRDAYSKNLVPALKGTMQPQAKLNDEKVRYIRENYKKFTTTYKMLAKKFGVDPGLIYRIVKGQNWTHVK